jgi:hypothetical protein
MPAFLIFQKTSEVQLFGQEKLQLTIPGKDIARRQIQ